MTKMKFSRENNRVKEPTKRIEDAGMDVYVNPVWFEENHEKGYMIIRRGQTAIIPTGLRYVLPPTHYVQVAERGSTGSVALKYGAGIGDSGYRGELNVIVTNCSDKDIVLYDQSQCVITDMLKDIVTCYPIEKGIAQILIKRVEDIEMEEVTKEEVLATPSERGEGKLGSSGK